MMEDKILVLSTRKSIHKPIEIKVDGKLYQNNPLSKDLFDQVRKHEKAAAAGDINALYAQVKLLFSVPIAKLNKLDIRDVNTLLEYAMAKTFQPSAKTDKEKAEKNGSKPGLNESV